MFKWLKKTAEGLSPTSSAGVEGRFAAAPTHADETPEDLEFPSWPPPSPRKMLARRAFYKERMRYRKYRAPEGVFEDTPLYALYRLYEWIMVDAGDGMRNELECFWWNRWPVASIPDPGEQGDPERYAVLACIPALLVESFYQRCCESGLQRDGRLRADGDPKRTEAEPAWAARVQPLRTLLHVPHSQRSKAQLRTLGDPGASPAFKRKNILIMQPDIHFV